MSSADDRVLQLLREARQALEAERQSRTEPIAIVGVGCRFPGGASTPQAFWRLLVDGVDATSDTPKARWDASALYDPDPDAPGKCYTQRGGFLEQIDGFEPECFGISPREALSLDPQQRLLLEVTWEALENAGIAPDSLLGSATGVWVGLSLDDYARRSMPPGDLEAIDAYTALGTARSVAAGRIAYVFGLQGPVLQLDTACSSSLVAVHLACQSLRARECELALVGGVNVMSSPEASVALCRLRALSRDGRCHTFDASAEGYGRGEGCGVVVLKRLSAAQAAGDRILAVIRGSAINHDGRSNGLTAPSGLAQEAVIRAALSKAAVDASQVSYVEAHGTGTLLGDPLEVLALQRVYGAGRAAESALHLGSVKTNLGHLEAAAGMAALIKTALCLAHDELVPHLNFRDPNPKIPWHELPMRVVTQRMAWPRVGELALAGVSSFGISGTNAHLVLEQARRAITRPPTAARAAELVLLSARTDAALQASAAGLLEHLAAHPELELRDVAYGLLTTRSGMDVRRAFAVSTLGELRQNLAAAASGADRAATTALPQPKLAFVFPGQGSQWLGMGRELLTREPEFRAQMAACDRVIAAETGWSLLEELAAPAHASRLASIDVVQPTLFAIQVSLAAWWRSMGVEPDMVVGHSMGEIAAACVAGALSLEGAAAVVCRRCRLLARIAGKGEMALVELALQEAESALAGLEDRLSVAVSNSRKNTVISGEPQALAQLIAELEGRGVFCRRVKVDVASHSPQVDPLLEALLQSLDGIEPRALDVPMYSTVTSSLLSGSELGARYWVDNLRQPVRFAAAIEASLAAGVQLFVEVSPHPLLLSAIDDLRRDAAAVGVAVGSLRREQPERLALLDSLGLLWSHGLALAPKRLFPDGAERVELPTYAWQRTRYWLDSASSQGHSSGPAARTRLELSQPVVAESAPADDLASAPRRTEFAQKLRELSLESALEVTSGIVRAEVARVLSVSSVAAVPLHKQLKDLGLDSLMATAMRQAVARHTGVLLSASAVAKRPTVDALSRHLLELATSEQASLTDDAPSEGASAGAPRVSSFEADLLLDPHIRRQDAASPAAELGTVLLTGATGFLGAFLLQELLHRTRARVACLVRAADAPMGLTRVVENLERYGLWDDSFSQRLVVLPGDLDEPRLGLSSPQFAELADGVDAIYNNGAPLGLVAAYDELKVSHVHATREILTLAARGRPKAVHHVSSSVVFDADAYHAREIPESLPPHESRGNHLGYAQCKWVTEQLVWQAAARGIPVTVHRPGFIAGSSLDGGWNSADFLCRLLKAIIEMGSMPGDLQMDLDFSPVDYVARSIVYLSRQPASRGRAFHLQHPFGGVALENFGPILSELGYPVRLVPFQDWLKELADSPASPLKPLLPFFTRRWPPKQLTYVELWERAHRPLLTCHETLEALAPAAIRCPPLDRRLIGRYLDYLARTGFIPPPLRQRA